jgi:nucleoid DNA-binding protein
MVHNPRKQTINLTKKDLTSHLHQSLGISQKEAKDAVQLLLDVMMEKLLQGSNVELRNFGVFEVQVRKQRIGRNPNKPKQSVIIPDRVAIKFKPGKEFKSKLKGLNPSNIFKSKTAAPAKHHAKPVAAVKAPASKKK